MSTNKLYEFESEEEAILALKKEGQRLIRIARKVWNDYLRSYTPQKYVRTHDSEMALILSEIEKIDEDTLGLRLNFLDGFSYHPSVVNKSGKPQGHSFMLISEGWTSRKIENKLRRMGRKPARIEHFTHYDGFNYIAKVMKEFESGRHQGITLEFQWAGSKFRKQAKQPNVLR